MTVLITFLKNPFSLVQVRYVHQKPDLDHLHLIRARLMYKIDEQLIIGTLLVTLYTSIRIKYFRDLEFCE